MSSNQLKVSYSDVQESINVYVRLACDDMRLAHSRDSYIYPDVGNDWVNRICGIVMLFISDDKV
jgi:hypothetical protein